MVSPFNTRFPHVVTAAHSVNFPAMTVIVAILILAAAVGVWRAVWDLRKKAPASVGPFRVHSDYKTIMPTTRFVDVAGNEAAKSQLEDIIDFLKRPLKYAEHGAKLPKGVLLTGPPGVGKTLLAKAVAGEAGVPFFDASGSDFVEMYVGVGAQRIRTLFSRAKKAAPSMVFIDEFDALARKREGTTNEESARTLNAFLVEMDGFQENEAVIVIAATNFADALDPAAIRPGRFDRHVEILPPDLEARKAILTVHARNKRIHHQVDLEGLARRTAGLSGAHLASMLNEAAIMSVREETESITQSQLNEALNRAIAGLKHPREFEEIKHRIAVHEAGHATVALALDQTFEHISIEARGKSLGHVFYSEGRDVPLKTKSELEREVQILLGGLVAEEMVFGEHSTGPANDLERANGIATNMIAKYGMNGSLVTVKEAERGDVEGLLNKWYEAVNAVLNEHIDFHEWLTDAVLVEGVMSGEMVQEKFEEGGSDGKKLRT